MLSSAHAGAGKKNTKNVSANTEKEEFYLRVVKQVDIDPFRVLNIKIKRREANRTLRIAAEGSDGYYTQSDINLEGANGAILHQPILRNLSPGIYIVSANVLDSSGETIEKEFTRIRICVASPGAPCGAPASEDIMTDEPDMAIHRPGSEI